MLKSQPEQSPPCIPAQERWLPQVHVAMLGSRRNYAVPRLLHEAGMLGRFYTDVYIGNKSWLGYLPRVIPQRLRPRVVNRLLGRKNVVIPAEKVISFDLLGLRYWWWQSKAFDSQALTHVYARGAYTFNRCILPQMYGADIIWGFNAAALELFQRAKQSRIPCIVEQTNAPRPVILDLLCEEIERWPGWQPGLILSPTSDPLSKREEVEWALADRIVVGSEFVVDGLVACAVDRGKCRVVPYGVDLQHFTVAKKQRKNPGDKLRVLFAGEVGLRKGAPYLLEALRQIGPKGIEARFAGVVSLAPQKLQPYATVAQFLGPVPRLQMAELFRWADVFVLPSICEGSAVVIYEAMASGIPVVTTPNSGSVARNGVDGHIVPVRDAEAISQILERYLKDADYLATQQEAAREGRDRVGLDAYRENLVQVIRDLQEESEVEACQK